MTQTKLASETGLSVSYLSLLEKNKRDPSVSTVQKIADALAVPSSIIFFLAADKSELKGLDDDIAEKLAFTALTIMRENKI